MEQAGGFKGREGRNPVRSLKYAQGSARRAFSINTAEKLPVHALFLPIGDLAAVLESIAAQIHYCRGAK